jgi:hypothetical protein
MAILLVRIMARIEEIGWNRLADSVGLRVKLSMSAVDVYSADIEVYASALCSYVFEQCIHTV